MFKKILTACCFLLQCLFAQNAALNMIEAEVIDQKKGNENLYFFIEKGETGNLSTRYFLNKQKSEDHMTLPKEYTFSLKRGRVNLFHRWMNPLTNNLITQDSVFDDPYTAEINTFFELVRAQFLLGNPFQAVEAFTESSATADQQAGGKQADAEGQSTGPKISESVAFTRLLSSFQNHDIRQWLFNVGTLERSILIVKNKGSYGLEPAFGPLISGLRRVDTMLSYPDTAALKKYAKTLLAIEDYEELQKDNGRFAKIKSDVRRKKEQMVKDELFRKELNNLTIGQLTYQDSTALNMVSLYTASLLRELEVDVKESNRIRKKQLELLEKFIDVLEKSVKVDGIKILDIEGVIYNFTKEVNLDRSKASQLQIFHQKAIFNTATEKFDKKDKTLLSSLTMYRYRAFVPGYALGIHYSPLKINRFGTGTDSLGQMVVQAVEEGGGSAILSGMLNMYWNIHATDVIPMFQLGVDPTKDRPFFLLGGGFALFEGNISVSGGAIWGWSQILDDLEVGDLVSGSAQVQENTRFRFEVEPRPYVGMQINIK